MMTAPITKKEQELQELLEQLKVKNRELKEATDAFIQGNRERWAKLEDDLTASREKLAQDLKKINDECYLKQEQIRQDTERKLIEIRERSKKYNYYTACLIIGWLIGMVTLILVTLGVKP